jgi:hypothetical protein
VLETLVSAVLIESARAIWPDDNTEPPIFAECRALLPDIEIGTLGCFPFYETARGHDTALVIATSEQAHLGLYPVDDRSCLARMTRHLFRQEAKHYDHDRTRTQTQIGAVPQNNSDDHPPG